MKTYFQTFLRNTTIFFFLFLLTINFLAGFNDDEVYLEGDTPILGMAMGSAELTGEFKRYHKLTFTWDGLELEETDTTFRDYRLNVTFTSPTGKTYIVPGYFAADGNAGETSATSGDKWRCHFTALETGNWTYSAAFRTGTNIAISFDTNEGVPVPSIDGETGFFSISETDKSGKDFRGKGKLQYVGEHFMQWTNGDYFMKIGSNSPENFFEYTGFDDTNSNRTYPNHIADWTTGDPTWKNQQGKGLIGAVNYLSDKGINGQYFVIQRNGEIASPWSDPTNSYYTYDVSRMDQWQIVVDYMMRKGLMAHFVFSESTNQSFFEYSVPSGDATFSDARKLYFRELVARFGYLNAVTWNIGEENGWNRDATVGKALTTQQQLDFTGYLDQLAYYEDFITVHNGPAGDTHIYDLLQGDNSITGTSMQGVHRDNNRSKGSTEQYRRESANSGRKWVMYYDEAWIGGATDTPTFRKNVLWPTLTSGGAGIEHYATNGLDVSLQDMRFYDEFYSQMKHAYDLYQENDIPFYEMYNQDELVTNGWCHGDDFNNYVIYVQQGEAGTTTMDFLGTYSVQWYDPRNGGDLQDGSVSSVTTGDNVNLGLPPSEPNLDWVVVIRDNATGPIAVTGVELNPETLEIGEGYSAQLNAQVLPGNAEERGVVWSSDDTTIVSVDENGNVFGVKVGTATISATTVDGGFVAQAIITVLDSSSFCTGSGSILMQRYDNISGYSLNDLFNAQAYPDAPNATIELDKFEIPADTADEYGVRVSGYLCAPESGLYTFWIAGDDHVGLNLSTDDEVINAVTIASHDSYTAAREWNKFNTQRSPEIPLQQGKRYYIEAFMKEGSGGDNLAVGWRKPSDGTGNLPIEIIPGNVLSPDATINVTGIELDINSEILEVGEQIALNASIIPANASNLNISWSSSDDSVATVDSNGNVTGVAEGSSLIVVETEDGGFQAQATVNVILSVTGISLDISTLSLELGKSFVLNPMVAPFNATDTSVVWTSDDQAIAAVDTNGIVFGNNPGTSTLRVTTNDGGFFAEVMVNVVVPVTGVELDSEQTEINLGGSILLNPTFFPSNATNRELVWTTNEDTIVSVNANGRIFGEAIGTAILTVTTVDGNFIDEVTVTVVDNTIINVTGIGIGSSQTELDLGESLELSSTILPSDATNQEIVWTTSDDTVVSVDANGIIAAETFGTATVAATTVDGGFIAEVAITVIDTSIVNVIGISFDSETVELSIGSTMVLNTSIVPTNASNQEVSWSTSNEAIVSVDTTGTISALSPGTVIVSVMTDDGSFSSNIEIIVLAEDVGQEFDLEITAVLIDVDTNEEILVLEDGMQIDLADILGRNLTITASTNAETVKTLEFSLSGALTHTYSDSIAPYSLYGRNDATKSLNGVIFEAGDFNLTLSATKEGALRAGETWQPRSISFSIVDLSNSVGTDINSGNVEKTKIIIYPNPTSEFITVVGADSGMLFSIYDVNGQLVKIGHEGTPIFVGDLNVATYLVRTLSGKLVRFVKR